MTGRNLKDVDLEIPLGRLTVVTGVSGSGKSTAVHDTLYRALAGPQAPRPPAARALPRNRPATSTCTSVVLVDQSPIGRSPRSTPATYTGLYNHIRKIFAQTSLARMRGYDAGRFSFNTAGGRCPVCEGAGLRRLTMDFLPDVEVLCEECGGRRFDRETLEVHFKGCDIAAHPGHDRRGGARGAGQHPGLPQDPGRDARRGAGLPAAGPVGRHPVRGRGPAHQAGQGTGRAAGSGHTLYILDEPTTGLHFCDVDRLMDVLGRLIAQDNTVLVIEHHPEVIRRADHVIDLGPEGGAGGGRAGGQRRLWTTIMAADGSYTGAMLRELFA